MEKKHELNLLERNQMDISGIEHVENFDEKEVILETVKGSLVIKGEGLNMTSLNLEEGRLALTGSSINSLSYFQSGRTKARNILQKILR